jgi:hypothetical protein
MSALKTVMGLAACIVVVLGYSHLSGYRKSLLTIRNQTADGIVVSLSHRGRVVHELGVVDSHRSATFPVMYLASGTPVRFEVTRYGGEHQSLEKSARAESNQDMLTSGN